MSTIHTRQIAVAATPVRATKKDKRSRVCSSFDSDVFTSSLAEEKTKQKHRQHIAGSRIYIRVLTVMDLIHI